MTERDAETLLATLLRRDGARVATQVSLGGKRVDLVVAWASTNDVRPLEAVEVKLRDWRRALSQAYLNSAYVGRTFIAMPSNPGRRIDQDLLTNLGVGLIEFDESGWRVVIEPSLHPTPASVDSTVRAALP